MGCNKVVIQVLNMYVILVHCVAQLQYIQLVQREVMEYIHRQGQFYPVGLPQNLFLENCTISVYEFFDRPSVYTSCELAAYITEQKLNKKVE